MIKAGKGRIISVDDDRVVVETKALRAAEGQIVRVAVPVKREMVDGGIVKMVDVIAQGMISKVSKVKDDKGIDGKSIQITVASKDTDLVVAKQARLDAAKKNPTAYIRFLQYEAPKYQPIRTNFLTFWRKPKTNGGRAIATKA